ncbi:hypothetical protein [Agromyces silvae]|uniref:hypothetical protein n=1 Tax=Agromyces silvae TaxID=3388266 RepID=UPI00280ACF42|nr:hypothetical protein [Agromyces protaetiae]
MSTNQSPARRHSPAVYRRRRLVVLLGLVAVIVAIVLIVVRPGASQGETGGGAGDTATPSTETAADPSASPSTDPGAAGGGACTPEQVIVEAITNQTEYAEGQQPELSITIRNIGDAPCTINAGTSAQVFTITSGAETYWTSTDCQTSPSDAEVTLEPGDPISSSVPIIWDRTRSSVETCDGPREAVPAGGASYHLDVTVDGMPSTASKQFLLY